MRAAGVSIAAPGDLTPARWYAYVDARRATGISPHTLNGELTLLRGWLWWLTDDEQPICARMLKVRPLRAPARLPKDLPPERLRALQRVIERESQHPEPHLHRRGLMDMAWFLLMLHSGLRTGESLPPRKQGSAACSPTRSTGSAASSASSTARPCAVAWPRLARR